MWSRPRDFVPRKRAALAIGFVFDHPLYEDLEPLGSLFEVALGGLTIGELLGDQVIEPLGRSGWSRHHRFDPGRLGDAIAGGQARSVALRRKGVDAAAARLGIGVATAPPAFVEASYDLADDAPAWRYDGTIEIGEELLGDDGEVDRLLEELLEQWFDRIDLHTGAVIADESIEDALALASATGGEPGSEVERRTTALATAGRQGGPRMVREPVWGTLLTLDHVDTIGGLDEIESYVQPYRVLEGRQCVLVQLSAYGDALEPQLAAKRGRLEAVLRPILAGPSSRDP